MKLSREDGEALIERIQASNLKISLKRLKVALFGEGRKKPKPPGGDGGGMGAGGEGPPRPARTFPDILGTSTERCGAGGRTAAWPRALGC